MSVYRLQTSQANTEKAEDRVWCKTVRGCHVALVIDGHGGKTAAEATLACMSASLNNTIGVIAAESACLSAFAECDSAVSSYISGCTVTLCVVEETGRVTCANVGDTDAWFVPKNARPILLSTTHAFQHSPLERTRVAAMGVHLSPIKGDDNCFVGPMRAWPGGLAIGRALGDADCPYTLPSPSLSTIETFGQAGVVVVGSDGLWDALRKESVFKSLLSGAEASKVVASAWNARRVDDISVAVVAIDIPMQCSFLDKLRRNGFSFSSSSSSDDDESRHLSAVKRSTITVPL